MDLHSKNNGGFASLIIIFIIATAVILILVFTVFRSSPIIKSPYTKSQVAINPVEPTAIDNWDIPDLPNGFNWQTIRLNKVEATDYKMFWSSIDNENSYGDIPFAATVYFTDLNYKDPKEILDYNGFISKFGEDMDSKGWKFDDNHGNKRIMGTAADGVFRNIYWG